MVQEQKDRGRIRDNFLGRKERSSKRGRGSKLRASLEAQCCLCPGYLDPYSSFVQYVLFDNFSSSYCLLSVQFLVFLFTKRFPSYTHLTSLSSMFFCRTTTFEKHYTKFRFSAHGDLDKQHQNTSIHLLQIISSNRSWSSHQLFLLLVAKSPDIHSLSRLIFLRTYLYAITLFSLKTHRGNVSPFLSPEKSSIFCCVDSVE